MKDVNIEATHSRNTVPAVCCFVLLVARLFNDIILKILHGTNLCFLVFCYLKLTPFMLKSKKKNKKINALLCDKSMPDLWHSVPLI